MELVYLWVQQYRNLKFNSGFSFTPEYKVSFINNTLKIEKDSNYSMINNFYGNEIGEVTAIVGKNGAGKTTVAQMLLEYGGFIKAINEGGSKKNNYQNFVQIYKVNDKIWVYYYLSGERIIKGWKDNDNVEKCYDVSKLNDYDYDSPTFDKESKKHNLTTVYISNVFDPQELGLLGRLNNYTIGYINKSLSYTPSYCLKLNRSLQKELYGQNINGLLLAIIDKYADRMQYDLFRDYLDYQALLFVRCYKSAPKNVLDNLSIFKRFLVGVHQFGSYLGNKHENDYDTLDNNVAKISKDIGKINDKNKNIFLQCFINILCEAYLFFGYDDNETKSNIGIEIDCYIYKKEHKIDLRLLEKIRNNILHLNVSQSIGNIGEVDWFKQLEDSIEVFKKYKENTFEVGYHNFEDKDFFCILDFIMDELAKEHSFFKRYLIFESVPSSSGELALVNLFAYINDAFTRLTCPNILLIIDELDANLHPRWQQLILKNLIEYINENKQGKKVQVIFTSHSPIMLSDMTKDRVIMIEKIKDEVIIKSPKEPVFGANISMLFYDSFFMDEGSIGEIAKDRIKDVITYNKGVDIISKYKASYIIDNIGEPIVQRKLRHDFNVRNIRDKDVKNELDTLIKNIGYEKTMEILKNSIKVDGIDD